MSRQNCYNGQHKGNTVGGTDFLCVCVSEELFNVLPVYLIITAVALTSGRLIAGIMNIYINKVIVTS